MLSHAQSEVPVVRCPDHGLYDVFEPTFIQPALCRHTFNLGHLIFGAEEWKVLSRDYDMPSETGLDPLSLELCALQDEGEYYDIGWCTCMVLSLESDAHLVGIQVNSETHLKPEVYHTEKLFLGKVQDSPEASVSHVLTQSWVDVHAYHGKSRNNKAIWAIVPQPPTKSVPFHAVYVSSFALTPADFHYQLTFTLTWAV